MQGNDYCFVTEWRVKAAAAEVHAILQDVESLARWWPSVYLEVKPVSPGDPITGIGKTVQFKTKGWLPYTLLWRCRAETNEPPRRLAISATGDFVGSGVWTLHEHEDWTDVRFDWAIAAEKPLLRDLSFLLRPIFELNHRWAMQRGLESLLAELERRRGKASVPAPPGPSQSSTYLFAALAGLLVGFLFFRRKP